MAKHPDRGYNVGIMEPIATYHERLPQVRRVFRLYRDRVVIDANWLLKGRFQSTVELSSLKAGYKQHYIRNKWFKTAGAIAAIGVVLVAYTIYPTVPRPLPVATIIGGVLALVGLALVGLTYRKVLFVRFPTQEGTPGLDIGRAGPDKAEFEKFIKQIQKRVRS